MIDLLYIKTWKKWNSYNEKLFFEKWPQFWYHLCKYCTISHRIVTVEKLFRGLFVTQDFVISSALERLNEIRESRLCDYIHGNRCSRIDIRDHIYLTISRVIRYVSNNQKSTNKRIATIKNILFCLKFEEIVYCLDLQKYQLTTSIYCLSFVLLWMHCNFSSFQSTLHFIDVEHICEQERVCKLRRFCWNGSRKQEGIVRLDIIFCGRWALITREPALKKKRKPQNYSSVDFGAVLERLFLRHEQMTRSFSRLENDWNFPETLLWFISAWRESSKLQRIFYKAWKKFMTRQSEKYVMRTKLTALKIKQISTQIKKIL